MPPTQGVGDRVLTVPNLLSLLRLLGVPVFLWLILGPQADLAAVLLLAVSGATDYLDGEIARRWNQMSRLGQLLDPLADRLYIFATLLGLGIRGIVPWWLLGLIVARDVVLGHLAPGPAAATATARRRCTTWARQRRSTCCTRSRSCCSVTGTSAGATWPGWSAGRSRSGAPRCTGGQVRSTSRRSATRDAAPLPSMRRRRAGGAGMKAVVMAGGEGTRLRPMTASMPKPLLPVVNRPIMEHVLRLLRRHGMTDIVVTVQFLASLVRNYFGDGEELGMKLQYATEEEPLGTAGSVKNAEEALNDGTFLVISGDALTDIDLTEPGGVPQGAEGAGHGLPDPGAQPARVRHHDRRRRRRGSSGSWRSRPGARCSPTPSTPAST